MEETHIQPPQDTSSNAKLVYILYLIGLVFGITGIIGVVMAYINKGTSEAWLESHYKFQIRTFWIGLLYIVVGTLLTFIIIGFLVYLFWVIWLIIRCVKGLQAIDRRQPIVNPDTWMFD